MYFLDLDEVVLYHFLGPESQFENFRFSNNFFMIAITLTGVHRESQREFMAGSEKTSPQVGNPPETL